MTVPPITPDATAPDRVGSVLVDTFTSPPAVAAPMVRPASVTVTRELAASAVPVMVMTMEVAPGAAGVSVVEPAAECVALGVEDTKKLDG